MLDLLKTKWHDVMIAAVVMVGAAMASGLLDGHPVATKAALAVLVVGATCGIKMAESWLPATIVAKIQPIPTPPAAADDVTVP